MFRSVPCGATQHCIKVQITNKAVKAPFGLFYVSTWSNAAEKATQGLSLDNIQAFSFYHWIKNPSFIQRHYFCHD